MKGIIVILFILLLTSVVQSKDIEVSREQLKIETKIKIEVQRAKMLERKRQHKIEMEIEFQKIINLYRNSQRYRNTTYNRNYYRQRRISPIRNRRYRNQNRIIIVYSGIR